MMDLVSIIVPVYQVESYLDQCLESIVTQTYRNLEIILVDDGSEDKCPLICDEWAKKDRRIHVLHKKNGGLSDARNAGLRLANGEYIAFIDSDDWIASGMIEHLVKACKDNDCEISACSVQMIGDDTFRNQLLTVQTNRVLNREQAQKALLEENLLKHPVWYKVYKAETIDGLFFEVGKFHEDVFWSYQAIGNANQVCIIDYIGYYYRQRADSIMGEKYSLKRLDVLEAVERRYQYIAEEFPTLEKAARLSILSNCIYHAQMSLKFLSKDEQTVSLKQLNSIKNRYVFQEKDWADMKITHRLWMSLGCHSLTAVARLKNMLNIGF